MNGESREQQQAVVRRGREQAPTAIFLDQGLVETRALSGPEDRREELQRV